MNIIRCSKGHFFDKDTFDECPHCRVIAMRNGASSSYSYGAFSRNTDRKEQVRERTSEKEPIESGLTEGTVHKDSVKEIPDDGSSPARTTDYTQESADTEHTFRIEALDQDAFVEFASGTLGREVEDNAVFPGQADPDLFYEKVTGKEGSGEFSLSDEKAAADESIEAAADERAGAAEDEGAGAAADEGAGAAADERAGAAEDEGAGAAEDEGAGAAADKGVEAAEDEEAGAAADERVEAAADERVKAAEDERVKAAADEVVESAADEGAGGAKDKGKAVQDLGDLPVGWLVCVKGPEAGAVYVLREGRNSIGRAETMTVALPGDTDLSSLNHAFVEYDAGRMQFYVLPGTSRGLCYVSDQLVLIRTPINNYERISLGESELMLVQLCGSHFNWDLS